MKALIKKKFAETYNLSIKPEEIGDDADLFGEDSEFGLDSMDVLMFINFLKQEFKLNLGAVNPESFKTVNNIVQFVKKQQEISSTNKN